MVDILDVNNIIWDTEMWHNTDNYFLSNILSIECFNNVFLSFFELKPVFDSHFRPHAGRHFKFETCYPHISIVNDSVNPQIHF